ncbi:MAG TPA: hypothetical protein VH951_01010 [Dehalococcoidia bacterium]|jgi:hypothetical protein
MSSLYHATDFQTERRLSLVVVNAMGVDFEEVSVSLVGRRVVVRGMAPSYIAKAKATESLRRAGYADIENCLRVVPGLPAA